VSTEEVHPDGCVFKAAVEEIDLIVGNEDSLDEHACARLRAIIFVAFGNNATSHWKPPSAATELPPDH
jgi:hypothetical protein